MRFFFFFLHIIFLFSAAISASNIDLSDNVEAVLQRFLSSVDSQKITERMEALRAAAANTTPMENTNGDAEATEETSASSNSPFWQVYLSSPLDNQDRVLCALAFWKAYSAAKLEQSPLTEHVAESPIYLNLLAMIKGAGGQPIYRGEIIEADLGSEVEMVHAVFSGVFGQLFPPVQAAFINDQEEVVVQALLPNEKSIAASLWLDKVLRSKDARADNGRRVLVSRLKMLGMYFLQGMPSDPRGDHNVRRMIEEYILANSLECDDRAVSGLDDAELDIHFSRVSTLEEAVQIVLKLYKRQLILDHLVAHCFAESAEEKIYLELMLNDYFNLGVYPVDISSAPCGARKVFDVAVQVIMEHLSFDGLLHYIVRESHFRRWMNAHEDYSKDLAEIISDPSEDVESRVVHFIQAKVLPIVHALFHIKGDKYQEIEAETLALLQRLTEGAVQEEV